MIAAISTRKTCNFTTKSLRKDGTFQGYASVFDTIDSDRDVIVKGAFQNSISLFKQGDRIIHLLWQHQSSEPIGVIDSMKEDAHGLFVRGRLLLDVQRGREAYSLLKEQALRGLSIGFIPKEVDHNAHGIRMIEQLDLFEISLVTFPANPSAHVHSVKSTRAEDSQHFMKRNNMTELTPHTDTINAHWEDYKRVNNERLDEEKSQGQSDPLTRDKLRRIEEKMEKCQSMVDEMHTHAMRPKLESLEAKASTHDYPHKRAFEDFIRKGTMGGLLSMEGKSLSGTSDPEGGLLIPPVVEKMVQAMLFERSPIRQLCASQQISSDHYEMLHETQDIEAGWVHETEMRKDTGTPELRKQVIRVHEMYAQPKATQKLIDDARIDIGQWIAEKIVDKFSRMENHSFLHGDGEGKPRGILSYESGKGWGKIERLQTENLNADDLLYALEELKDHYATHASFLMHPSTMRAVRMLKDNEGRYLWSPEVSGKGSGTLFGHPVYRAADMPSLHQGKAVIAVGDFKSAYQILDRSSIRMLRDPYTEKPFVKFYATKRLGGDITQFDAIKLLEVGRQDVGGAA